MKAGFIGLGLIGGSIARAIRFFYSNAELIAYSRTRASVEEAVHDGVINRITDGISEEYSDCDYIFLCAPVESNAAYLAQLKNIIKPSVIITDVGSTKSDIHAKVSELGMETNFIGGHPMAGSEKTGYRNSKRILIENAYYVITPTPCVSEEAVEKFRDLVASLKALPLILDANQHDYLTAGVSHVPHIIASALVNLVKSHDTKEGYMKMIAAGGFKDITRIASSSPEMWEQICMTNRKNVASILGDYIESLQEAKAKLEEAQDGYVYQMFEESRDYRNSLPIRGSGPIERIYDIYCDLMDEVGGIAALATILAANQINLKNIGIVHSRGMVEAALHIEFYDAQAKAKAIEVLKKYRYTVFEL